MASDVLAAMQEAGARALNEHVEPHVFVHAIEGKPHAEEAVSAAVLRAALPALREAVEGLPRIPGYSRGLVPLDAVLALLADVQGDGDA